MYFLVLPQQSSLLALYGPVLLHLLGNIGKYSPSCQTNTENQILQYCPTKKDNNGRITFINWECLYYDSSQDIRWNRAWALGKSFVLRLYFTLYHGLATFTDVTFVNVHQAQMSTFVIEVYIWYIGFVLVFNWSLHY